MLWIWSSASARFPLSTCEVLDRDARESRRERRSCDRKELEAEGLSPSGVGRAVMVDIACHGTHGCSDL